MSNSITPNELADHLKTAKNILKTISAWWTVAEQVRGGTGTIPAVATLILPQDVWTDLTKEKQVSLTFYAENMINDVRKYPEKYLTISPSAPTYQSMLVNYRNISDDFWEIIIGRFINEDSKRLMVDSSVVRGDAFWDYEKDKFGVKASSFREIEEASISLENLIPNADKSIVDIRKLRDYCLNLSHDKGKHKAQLFLSIFGMTAADAENLQQILLETVKITEAKVGRRDEFGQRYTLDFILEWKDKSSKVRSGWIIENSSDIPRLTTCYPL